MDYCIESFHPLAVRWLKKHRPDVCRGQLSENFLKTRTGLGRGADFVMTHLLTSFLTTPDFIAYNPKSGKNETFPRACLCVRPRAYIDHEQGWHKSLSNVPVKKCAGDVEACVLVVAGRRQ